MLKHKIILAAIVSAFFLPTHLAHPQSGPASGLYQILSGSYSECCGIAGNAFVYPLPNEKQSFLRFTVDAQTHLATLTFLASDLQTVFGTRLCPSSEPIQFSFDYGLVLSNYTFFHVDPGPPPYGTYWSYTVSNSVDRLQLGGTLGTSQAGCADVPTRFTHSNVVAVLLPGPRLRLTEVSKEGTLLFVQGQAGWTHVIEASTDLVTWTSLSTNLMPTTLCPICPYFLYRDAASTNLARRFYRCFEIP